MPRRLRNRIIPDQPELIPRFPLRPCPFLDIKSQIHADRPCQDAFFSIPELRGILAKYLTERDARSLSRVCREWHVFWKPFGYTTLSARGFRQKRILPILSLFSDTVKHISLQQHLSSKEVGYIIQQPWSRLVSVDLLSTYQNHSIAKAFVKYAHLLPRLQKLSTRYIPQQCAHGRSMLSCIRDYLPELRELSIIHFDDSRTALLQVLRACQKLETLHVYECLWEHGNSDNDNNNDVNDNTDNDADDERAEEGWVNTSLKALTGTPDILWFLSGLGVSKMANFSVILRHLPNIERICWRYPYSPPHVLEWDLFWSNVLPYLPNLRVLQITDFCIYGCSTLDALAILRDSCPRFHTLQLKTDWEWDDPDIMDTKAANVPPNMEVFRVDTFYYPEPIVAALASHSSHTLRQLTFSVCGGWPSSLPLMLQRCERLEVLEIGQGGERTREEKDVRLCDSNKPWACEDTLTDLILRDEVVEDRMSDGEDEDETIVSHPYTTEDYITLRDQLQRLRRLRTVSLTGPMFDLLVVSQSNIVVTAAGVDVLNQQSNSQVKPSILERVESAHVQVLVQRHVIDSSPRTQDDEEMKKKRGMTLLSAAEVDRILEDWLLVHPGVSSRRRLTYTCIKATQNVKPAIVFNIRTSV